MKQVSRARFNAFAGFARSPHTVSFLDEIEWFESDSGKTFAVLFRDIDGLYGGAVFAPDLAKRFRWVSGSSSEVDRAAALAGLTATIDAVEADFEAVRVQGDEGPVVDFFAPVVPEARFHRRYAGLAAHRGHIAARRLIELMMPWYENVDGNFVEQVQTAGFDARIWELYIFATLIEAGHAVSFPNPAPDFLATGRLGLFYVEATTVNPSGGGEEPDTSHRPQSDDEVDDYVAHYLPIRFAARLIDKLEKQYWNNPDVDALPLVFAIQDFHDADAMTYSGHALPTYLYGRRFDKDPAGSPMKEHKWGSKVVPSGFFSIPGSEHVSAVLFNPSGTMPKFNRLGIGVGLGHPAVDVTHIGQRRRVADTVTIVRFSDSVTEGYPEQWIDGMNVYHNPNALHPLDPELLVGATHYRFVGGRLDSISPAEHLLGSQTLVINKV